MPTKICDKHFYTENVQRNVCEASKRERYEESESENERTFLRCCTLMIWHPRVLLYRVYSCIGVDYRQEAHTV